MSSAIIGFIFGGILGFLAGATLMVGIWIHVSGGFGEE